MSELYAALAGLLGGSDSDRPKSRMSVLFGTVEQAGGGPEIRLSAIAQLLGEPAHHRLHRQGVAQMKGLLVELLEQLQGLLPCQFHGLTPPSWVCFIIAQRKRVCKDFIQGLLSFGNRNILVVS